MSNTTNQIKSLVQRFVSLEPALRMKVTKKLLEFYNSEQASPAAKPSTESVSPLLRKSFLEQFWDEVENAHGDRPGTLNPFTEERRSKARRVGGTPSNNEQGGYLPWRIGPSDLFALL
jgi:hypothetical protein